MVFAHYLENCLSQRFHIHMLIGLGENTLCDVFKFTRSKVKVTCVIFGINYVKSFDEHLTSY